MDWISVGSLITAAGAAAAAAWRVRRLQKEVRQFEAKVEQALDDMLSGRETAGNEEEIKDTLWGKCGEKLGRAEQIWRRKEEESLLEKKQMKELISDISHQTKTPIANIKLYLEFLSEEELSEKGRGFLKNLEGQADKLDFLLQGMVKLSRLEAGIIQIRSEPGNLYETLTKSVTAIVPAAAAKRIILSVDCEETYSLRYDKKWTEEAVFNVLDNAVKYTESYGKIHVKVIRQEIFTRISIADTGKGIPTERQAEIFARFYREPEVHEESGVGIGLYLTRKILELQGGYIEVRSRMGRGSEFCLYLPNG
ncbi:MAG: HAMP domain-containing histidine kinase [Dorea sp.]|jgi:signal transduction histidine kinase|nr:HAMP domain-containing histidine kinase [Dorea sp.]